MAGRTPIFSFDTPARDCTSRRNIRNSTVRDVLQSIVAGSPTAAATQVTEMTSAPVLTHASNTTDYHSDTIWQYSNNNAILVVYLWFK